MVLDHVLLHSYPTTDSNTSMGMIRVTLNMPSATEECREPSGNRQGISHSLESGHPGWKEGLASELADYAQFFSLQEQSVGHRKQHVFMNVLAHT